MMDDLISALKRVNADSTWKAFKQENGTIPLQLINESVCVNPLYRTQATVLMSHIRHVLRGERSVAKWEKLDAAERAAVKAGVTFAFEDAGFPLVMVKMHGRSHTTIRTTHGLLLAG